MVDQDCFFLPPGSGSRFSNSSCINMMERGGSWKPNVELSPACPRCGSSNTKFCYYNNYSLTQPRYFCKGCRRYWTKGGSLRNVPVGGGCRKSRRTNIKPPSAPPIRVPSSATLSTNIIHGNVVVPSPFGLISATPHRHSPSSTSNTPATPSSNGPNIDLAVVYANFLNPNKPQPPPEPASYQHHHHHHRHHQQHHEIIPQLPNDNTNIIDNSPGPSFEFVGVQNNLNLDLTAPHEQGLSHDHNHVVYHSSELDSIHHHHHLFTNVSTNNDFSSNINSDNYVLPPMPDDEELLAVSQEMAWSSSINNAADLMLPASRQLMDVDQSSPPSSAVQPQHRNCQRTSNENDDEMNSLINIPNFEDIFKT